MQQKAHAEATKPTKDTYKLTPYQDIFEGDVLKKAKEIEQQKQQADETEEKEEQKSPKPTEKVKKVKKTFSKKVKAKK